MATGAINASLEIQAWGRAIRVSMLLQYRSKTDIITNMRAYKVSQLYEVLVIRCRTLNSHDRTRDSRQMDKALMDMATRSWSPTIQQLLVDLLNEGNDEVREAHSSVEGKRIKAEAEAEDLGLEDLLEGQSRFEAGVLSYAYNNYMRKHTGRYPTRCSAQVADAYNLAQACRSRCGS